MIDKELQEICESEQELRQHNINEEDLKIAWMNPEQSFILISMLKMLDTKSDITGKREHPVFIKLSEIDALCRQFNRQLNIREHITVLNYRLKSLSSNITIGYKLLHWQNRVEIIPLVKQIIKSSLLNNNSFIKGICRVLFQKLFFQEQLKLPELFKKEDKCCEQSVNLVPELLGKQMLKIELQKKEIRKVGDSRIYQKIKTYIQTWKREQFRYCFKKN